MRSIAVRRGLLEINLRNPFYRRGSRQWYDVLENGPASQFATYFDIDWSPSKADLSGKVLLPILGDLLDRLLSEQAYRLSYWRVGQ